jgi:hypothetical protein
MFDDFDTALTSHWTQTCLGPATLAVSSSTLRLAFSDVQEGRYADAQIDDYGSLARSAFPWKLPLRMEVCSRASLPAATTDDPSANFLRGTAGFGFWNYPFSVRGDILMLPEAVWFFYASAPSNMALVPGIPGWGWKAQVVHSMRPGALLATIPTALSTGWGILTGNTQPASHWLQRLSGAQEALLNVDMTSWHTYSLEWHETHATFFVDGTCVLRAPQPPSRALGFVAWLDNQYAIATPRGTLRFGTVASGSQWLDLASIRIEPL